MISFLKNWSLILLVSYKNDFNIRGIGNGWKVLIEKALSLKILNKQLKSN